MTGIPTLGVGLSEFFNFAIRGFCWLYLLSAWCQMLSGGSSALLSVFCGTRRFALVCQRSDYAFHSILGEILDSESSHPRRRFSGALSDHIPSLVYDKCGV